MDDHRLLERIWRGDEAAFADLFARHRAPVYRYAAHMIGPSDANDVVQETFLALLRQRDRYDVRRGPLQAYLLGIARRLIFRQFAAATAERRLEADAAVQTTATVRTPFDDLDRVEAIGRVRAAIGELPAVYREVIVLCELNELDYARAADVIGCPIGTVRSRLHRARGLLLERLGAKEQDTVSVNGR